MTLFEFYTNYHLGEIFTSVGFFGTLGTIVGLCYTFKQVKDSKTISKNTETAVNQIKNDFHKLNVVSELTNSYSEAYEIRKLMCDKNYKDIPDRCFNLIISLNTAKIALIDETEEQTKIQEIIVSLNEIQSLITAHNNETKSIEDFTQIVDKVNDHIMNIHIMKTTHKSLIGKGS